MRGDPPSLNRSSEVTLIAPVSVIMQERITSLSRRAVLHSARSVNTRAVDEGG